MNPIIVAGIRMTTDTMSMEELAAIYLAASSGNNPIGVLGYDKARSLFTEHGGTRMHREALDALNLIVRDRLDKEYV